MIQYADENTKPAVRAMWKAVFGDKDEYIDLIFTRKYRHENILIYVEDDKPVASLQMFPYTIRFYGADVPFYYLAGLCTLPEYRNKGIMGKLIVKSFQVMQERGIPLSILVPAEDWLYGYYEKYGYVQTFEKGKEPLNMKSILDIYTQDAEAGFSFFDSEYQQDDFCVLKSPDDLKTIIDEYILDGCPPKYNLGAMSRILDPLYVLEKYALKNPTAHFALKIVDKHAFNNSICKIQNGRVLICQNIEPDFEIDQKILTQLLFGYDMGKLSSEYGKYFSTHHPVINLMLE